MQKKLHLSAHGIASIRLIVTVIVGFSLTGCLSLNAETPKFAFEQKVTPDGNQTSGWEYLERNNAELAEIVFGKELNVNPEAEESRFGLAESLRRQGRGGAAEAEYAKLLSSESYRVWALEGIGFSKLQAADFDGAKEAFELALADDVSAWKAWLGMAQLYDFENDWIGADDAYERALEFTDHPALVLNNQGVSMMARGQPEQAVALFDEALADNPQWNRAQTNRQLATAAISSSLAENSDYSADAKERARRLNNAGYVAMLAGDFDKAESLFNQAASEHPAFYPTAFKNLHALNIVKRRAR